jgi:hypothetical protein
LFVLNILVLVWNFLQTESPLPEFPQPEAGSRHENSDIPRITLLSEQNNIIRGSSLTEPSGLQCFTLGPFSTPAEYRVMETRLRSNARSIAMRETQKEVEQGHWVYLAPEEDPEELSVSLAVLSAGGVQGYSVIEQGPDANAISLGLYSKLENAKARKQILEDMGLPFNFRIDPKRQTQTQYWLEYESLPDKIISLDDLVENKNGLSVQSLECAEPAWIPEDSITRSMDSPTVPPTEELEAQNTNSGPGSETNPEPDTAPARYEPTAID